MADKYINEVGLQAIRTWADGKFALDSDLDNLSAEVQEIISEGGEPNTIETVKVNGTALTPDAQKAVDITVPTATSDLTNDGDGTSNFATEDYVDENGGKIDSISVNNVPQTIDANKNVNITATNISEVEGTLGIKATSSWGETGVAGFANNHTASLNIDGLMPRALSDFDNDEGFQTASDVQAAISSAVASVYKYKGSVATYADLPTSGQAAGDVYDVQDTGINYAWTGSAWDALGTYVDTSVLWTSVSGQTNSLVAMTTAEVSAILNA